MSGAVTSILALIRGTKPLLYLNFVVFLNGNGFCDLKEWNWENLKASEGFEANMIELDFGVTVKQVDIEAIRRF